jgi:hypothetical protein
VIYQAGKAENYGSCWRFEAIFFLGLVHDIEGRTGYYGKDL